MAPVSNICVFVREASLQIVKVTSGQFSSVLSDSPASDKLIPICGFIDESYNLVTATIRKNSVKQASNCSDFQQVLTQALEDNKEIVFDGSKGKIVLAAAYWIIILGAIGCASVPITLIAQLCACLSN